MEDKIPNISSDIIKRLIERDFSKMEVAEIMELLNVYESNTEKGRNRIHACILKLANGDKDLVKKYVEMAIYDFRDVISLAEYPGFSKHRKGFSLSEEERKQIRIDDWNQYVKWLTAM